MIDFSNLSYGRPRPAATSSSSAAPVTTATPPVSSATSSSNSSPATVRQLSQAEVSDVEMTDAPNLSQSGVATGLPTPPLTPNEMGIGSDLSCKLSFSDFRREFEIRYGAPGQQSATIVWPPAFKNPDYSPLRESSLLSVPGFDTSFLKDVSTRLVPFVCQGTLPEISPLPASFFRQPDHRSPVLLTKDDLDFMVDDLLTESMRAMTLEDEVEISRSAAKEWEYAGRKMVVKEELAEVLLMQLFASQIVVDITIMMQLDQFTDEMADFMVMDDRMDYG